MVDDDEDDIVIGRPKTIRRGLYDTSAFCQEIARVGIYAGYACCGPLDHDGDHYLTFGGERGYSWPRQSKESGK